MIDVLTPALVVVSDRYMVDFPLGDNQVSFGCRDADPCHTPSAPRALDAAGIEFHEQAW
jgi:hypothetical protein